MCGINTLAVVMIDGPSGTFCTQVASESEFLADTVYLIGERSGPVRCACVEDKTKTSKP